MIQIPYCISLRTYVCYETMYQADTFEPTWPTVHASLCHGSASETIFLPTFPSEKCRSQVLLNLVHTLSTSELIRATKSVIQNGFKLVAVSNIFSCYVTARVFIVDLSMHILVVVLNQLGQYITLHVVLPIFWAMSSAVLHFQHNLPVPYYKQEEKQS